MAQAAKVFVSHAHEDNDWCRAFVQALRSAGADVWYDEHNLGYGALTEQIERELESRPIFLVVITPQSVIKRWVQREVTAAINLRDEDPTRVIIPVVAETAKIPLFWKEFKRACGPGDTGLAALDAAARIVRTLAIKPAEAPPTDEPSEVTETAEEANDRGKGLYAQRRYEEALAAYNHALDLDPGFTAALHNKGLSLERLRRYDDALAAYERALAIDPQRPLTWYNKGRTLVRLHRYGEALDSFEHALALDPLDVTAHNSEIYVLRKLGRMEAAKAAIRQRDRIETLAACERATALSPDDSAAWVRKGDALRFMHRDDDALAAYDQALSLEPQNAEAWAGKGEVLAHMGRYNDALVAFERAVSLNPQDVSAWFGVGDVLFYPRRYEDAVSAYNRAIALDAQHIGAWTNKAYALLLLGQYEEARNACEQALALDPGSADAQMIWGYVAR